MRPSTRSRKPKTPRASLPQSVQRPPTKMEVKRFLAASRRLVAKPRHNLVSLLNVVAQQTARNGVGRGKGLMSPSAMQAAAAANKAGTSRNHARMGASQQQQTNTPKQPANKAGTSRNHARMGASQQQQNNTSKKHWDIKLVPERKRVGPGWSYRVQWEGVNPNTGQPWNNTWEPRSKLLRDLGPAWMNKIDSNIVTTVPKPKKPKK